MKKIILAVGGILIVYWLNKYGMRPANADGHVVEQLKNDPLDADLIDDTKILEAKTVSDLVNKAPLTHKKLNGRWT